MVFAGSFVAMSSSPRPWSDVFTSPEKNQHGGDRERSRLQGPKNVHHFLIIVGAENWACDHVTEMLLILKKTIFDRPKKCPTILWSSTFLATSEHNEDPS